MIHAQPIKLLDEATWRRVLACQVEAAFESHSRRNWRRYHIDGEITVKLVLDGKPRTRTWNLLQVAAGGLTVRTGEVIAADTPVDLRIQFDETPLFAKGVTCHCTQTLGGFKVGIRLIFDK